MSKDVYVLKMPKKKEEKKEKFGGAILGHHPFFYLIEQISGNGLLLI